MKEKYLQEVVKLDNTLFDVHFSHQPAEPENGVPEDYEVVKVYLRKSIFDLMGFLSDETIERIVKQLEKQKGEI